MQIDPTSRDLRPRLGGKKKKRKIIMKFLQNDSCLRVMATYFTSFRNRRPVQHKNPDFSVDDHLRRRGTKTKRKTERRRFLSSRSYWSLARSNKRRPPRHSAGRHVQLNVQLFIVIIIDIIWIVIMIIHGSIGWRRGSYVRMRARKAEEKRKILTDLVAWNLNGSVRIVLSVPGL